MTVQTMEAPVVEAPQVALIRRPHGGDIEVPLVVVDGKRALPFFSDLEHAVMSPTEADARSRFKTVTKTFSNTAPITINDNAQATPYPSQNAVGGFKKGRIRDVNLSLNGYTHTYPTDVDVLLIGPQGHNAVVMSDAGFSHDVNGVNLLLDDAAASSLPNFEQIVSGTYRPANYAAGDVEFPVSNGESELSVFNSTRPNGTWSLYVRDDAFTDAGQFAGGWALTIKARVLR